MTKKVLINQESPVQKDYDRKVNYDEDGNEIITYEEVDYPTLQQSLGTWDMWSLNSLMKAGIDPAFPIHTGYNTRLDGINDLQQVDGWVDELLNSSTENDTK